MIPLFRTLALLVLIGSTHALAQTSTPLLPSDDGLAAPQDNVVVAADTHRVAVGMPGAFSGQGIVLVFDRTGDTWTQTATLVADDAGPERFFGRHVALDGDAIVAASQAPLDPFFGIPGGEVYRFELVAGLDGEAWDQRQK